MIHDCSSSGRTDGIGIHESAALYTSILRAARALSVGRANDACAHVRKDMAAGSRDPV